MRGQSLITRQKNANGADCPMEGSFTLKITDSSATLAGQFNPVYEYRVTCPAIDIKFTKSVAKKPKKIPKDKPEEVAAAAPVERVKTDTSEPVKKTTAVAIAPALFRQSQIPFAGMKQPHKRL